MALTACFGATHAETAGAGAQRKGAVPASQVGADVAEFPAIAGAARACRIHGTGEMLGAPDLFRGGGHSGNAAPQVLVAFRRVA